MPDRQADQSHQHDAPDRRPPCAGPPPGGGSAGRPRSGAVSRTACDCRGFDGLFRVRGEGALGTTNVVSLPRSYQRADVGANDVNAGPDQVLLGYPDEAAHCTYSPFRRGGKGAQPNQEELKLGKISFSSLQSGFNERIGPVIFLRPPWRSVAVGADDLAAGSGYRGRTICGSRPSS